LKTAEKRKVVRNELQTGAIKGKLNTVRRPSEKRTCGKGGQLFNAKKGKNDRWKRKN